MSLRQIAFYGKGGIGKSTTSQNTLAALADGVVVVVQAGRTKRPVLTRSVDMVSRAGGRVLGMVLNRRRLEIPGFIYRRI